MGRGRAVEKTEREVGWGRKGLGGRGGGLVGDCDQLAAPQGVLV